MREGDEVNRMLLRNYVGRGNADDFKHALILKNKMYLSIEALLTDIIRCRPCESTAPPAAVNVN